MNSAAARSSSSSDAAANAALQGANLAFQEERNKNKKPAAPPPKKRNNRDEDNGALSAAVTSTSRPRSPAKLDNAPLLLDKTNETPPRSRQLHPTSTGRTVVDPKSPSFIAATLAASRSVSPSPVAVDSGPIASTGSLISMFERDKKKASSSPGRSLRDESTGDDASDERERSRSPSQQTSKAKPKTKPKPKPKPQLPSGTKTPPRENHARRSAPELVSPTPRRLSRPILGPETPPQIIMRAATQTFSPPSPDPQKRSPRPRQRPPTPPQPRGSSNTAKSVVSAPKLSVGRQKEKVTAGPPKAVQQLPPPVAPRKPATATETQRPSTADTTSSNDTFVSASSVQSPERQPSPAPAPAPPPPSRRRAPASLPPSPTRQAARQLQRPTNASTNSLALDNLTNAIMAGSLAASRLTPHSTGGSNQPPLPKRQRSPHLMQTLRQPAKVSDDDNSSDRPARGHLHKLQKGKHAHHEGSRKRWREELTERERKRYEAVWASNRGLLLFPPGVVDEVPPYVVNVVVREIWKRSRLPEDELAEVWDLVNRERRGMLGRQEFVVGMWLIDQRLRGRKIPAKVSDSVWGSANGVKVIRPKMK